MTPLSTNPNFYGDDRKYGSDRQNSGEQPPPPGFDSTLASDSLRNLQVSLNSFSIKEKKSLPCLEEFDKQLVEIRWKAVEKDPEALALLYQCAADQEQRNRDRQQRIDELQSNSFFRQECLLTQRNPLFGYTYEPSYYMTADQNAYFQLALYFSSIKDDRQAAQCFAKAIQLTGFIGKIPEIPDLVVYLKASYHELIRRIPDKEMQRIQNETSRIENIDDSIRFLAKNINRGNYEFLWNHPSAYFFPHVALQGIKSGWITIEQFSTLMNFRSLKEANVPYDKIELLSISEPRARSLIQNTMQPVRLNKDEVFGDTPFYDKKERPFLDQQGLDAMYKQMEEAFPSERFIVLVDDIPMKNSFSIGQFISYEGGFNVFGRTFENNKRIVPSSSLEEAFLKARFKKPVLPNYVLGPSTAEDIRLNGLNFTRDVQIPFPQIPLPCKADGRLAPRSDEFRQHDFFHCYSSSEVGEDGPLFIKIADHVKAHKSFDINDEGAEIFWGSLIDLDFPTYRHHVNNPVGWVKSEKYNVSREATVWHELAGCATLAGMKNPLVNNLLESATRFLLQTYTATTLREASEHVNLSLKKQKDYLADPSLQSNHPIFFMANVLNSNS